MADKKQIKQTNGAKEITNGEFLKNQYLPLSHPDYLDGLTPEEIIQLPKEEMELLMGQTVQKMHMMDAKRKLNHEKPSGVI